MFAPELLLGDQLPLEGTSSVPTHWLGEAAQAVEHAARDRAAGGHLPVAAALRVVAEAVSA